MSLVVVQCRKSHYKNQLIGWSLQQQQAQKLSEGGHCKCLKQQYFLVNVNPILQCFHNLSKLYNIRTNLIYKDA